MDVGVDVVRSKPPDCSANIARHERSYPFSDLVPIYGLVVCKHLAGVWENAYRDVNASTTYNEFRQYKRLLRDIALQKDKDAPTVFEALSSGKPVPPHAFTAYVAGLRMRILNPEDKSFTNAGHDSVVKYLEQLRNCLNRLTAAKLFPEVEISTHGMYANGIEVKTPCFATIAIEAGRFKLDGDNDHDNAIKFHVTNRDLLAALRASLVEVFNVGYQRYQERMRLLEKKGIPSVSRIIRALKTRATLQGANARGNRGEAKLLDGTEDYVLAVAVRAFKALYYRNNLPISRSSLQWLLQKAGGAEFVARIAEPCSDTLMAAATIVQIDTGWEAATVLNMDVDPFVGKTRKNNATVRAVASRKKRAQGKIRNAALLENEQPEPDRDATVPVKQRGLTTGYQIILAYKEMTADIRDEFPKKQSAKLWLSRAAQGLNEVVYDAFNRFLRRHKEHPKFGGLPLTRRSIKRTKFNVDAGATEGNLGLARARGDHSDTRQSIAYLSEPAVRALFHHKIREYINQMEALIYDGVDDLAQKLGIPASELHRRKLLGIENGLTALTVKKTHSVASSSEDFDNRAKTLRPDDDALRSLCIAGEAIDARWEEMAAKNPSRFLRTWVPWMALIQAMVQKIKQTRHRVKFRRIFDEVRQEIDAGDLLLPLVR
ncbi:hypothetical protein [Rhizobium leguminosarum]